ncbi:GNAT family N-acetyltransferase [Dyadobacter tibetensis]|uniref:GNAT family N-acetyltransferase n=1 Tax=Dyadobacter tibetensis TaxID=1211851 RepID=UPI0004713AEF|nr:GNAT family N-acetyltransferase [Dyadobacter tibetensis]
MPEQVLQIEKFTDRYREGILQVWEESVLATHNFLKTADFHAIKEFHHDFNFQDLDVYCLVQDDCVLGFIGVAERKIEMLFLRPDYIGQGLGSKLLNFALYELKADKVDVNEQNSNAVAFYQHHGFRPYERTEKDDQGLDYPLLRMKL